TTVASFCQGKNLRECAARPGQCIMRNNSPCPSCGKPVEHGGDRNGHLLKCPGCGYGEDARDLVDWYRMKARAFLERLESEKLRDFDKDLEQVRDAQMGVEKELAICFLGNCGVGKSTLVNALVADNQVIVPAGGIGPLTAQALVVAYGE